MATADKGHIFGFSWVPFIYIGLTVIQFIKAKCQSLQDIGDLSRAWLSCA